MWIFILFIITLLVIREIAIAKKNITTYDDTTEEDIEYGCYQHEEEDDKSQDNHQ